MRYVILLRGINVGGKNTLPMPALRAAFMEEGFSDVVTYINSGNLLFSHDETDTTALKIRCEVLIQSRFGLNIPVAVIPAADLRAAVAHAPAWWNRDADSKHNAIFVIAPATAEEVSTQVGAIKPEYERIAHHGQVIFWSAPIKTFSRTRWSKVVSTAAYGSITIRNANTALKLAELAAQG